MGKEDYDIYLDNAVSRGLSPIMARRLKKMGGYNSLLARSKVASVNAINAQELGLRQQALNQSAATDAANIAYRDKQSQIQQDQYEESQDVAKKNAQTQTYSDAAKTGLTAYAYGKGQGWWGSGGTTAPSPGLSGATAQTSTAYTATGQPYTVSNMQTAPSYSYPGDPTAVEGVGGTGVATPVNGTEAGAPANGSGAGTGFNWAGLGVGVGIAAQRYFANNTTSWDKNISGVGAENALSNRNAEGRWTPYAATVDPWQGYGADKMGVEPTASQKFDAAQAGRDKSGMRKNAPETFSNWATPGNQLISRGWAAKATGYNYDPEDPDGTHTDGYREYRQAKAFIDPGSRLLEELGDSSTVICTELHRQGYLPDELYELDALFGRMMNPVIHAGYRKMADPVVSLMKKSKVFTWAVSKLALPWALEMAHIMRPNKHKGHRLGKIIMKIGLPLCKAVGKKEAQYGVA